MGIMTYNCKGIFICISIERKKNRMLFFNFPQVPFETTDIGVIADTALFVPTRKRAVCIAIK